MMKSVENRLYVYADWQGVSTPKLIGHLSFGEESVNFEYNKRWLKGRECSLLDPALILLSKEESEPVPAAYRLLLSPLYESWSASLLASKGITTPSLDALLSISDEARVGALRFKLDPKGEFVSQEESIPSWRDIGDLAGDVALFEESGQPTERLFGAGVALGGDRPKALVGSDEGGQWVAKFPSRGDSYDVEAWSKVLLDMARESGIRVPDSELIETAEGRHILLTRRFDRTPDGKRLHTATAEELFTAEGREGSGYLSLVEFITSRGADVVNNLEELWRRILFNIATTNSDDTLSNHSFTHTDQGWVLSPAYDLNPDPESEALSLEISEGNRGLDFEYAFELVPHFRIPMIRALMIEMEVSGAVEKWRDRALACGISEKECDMMSGAFKV